MSNEAELMSNTPVVTFKAELNIDHLVDAQIAMEEAKLKDEGAKLRARLPELRQTADKCQKALNDLLNKAPVHPGLKELATLIKAIGFDELATREITLAATGQLTPEGRVQINSLLNLGYRDFTKKTQRPPTAVEKKAIAALEEVRKELHQVESEIGKVERLLQEWNSAPKRRALGAAYTLALARNSKELQPLIRQAGAQKLLQS